LCIYLLLRWFCRFFIAIRFSIWSWTETSGFSLKYNNYIWLFYYVSSGIIHTNIKLNYERFELRLSEKKYFLSAVVCLYPTRLHISPLIKRNSSKEILFLSTDENHFCLPMQNFAHSIFSAACQIYFSHLRNLNYNNLVIKLHPDHK